MEHRLCCSSHLWESQCISYNPLKGVFVFHLGFANGIGRGGSYDLMPQKGQQPSKVVWDHKKRTAGVKAAGSSIIALTGWG